MNLRQTLQLSLLCVMAWMGGAYADDGYARAVPLAEGGPLKMLYDNRMHPQATGLASWNETTSPHGQPELAGAIEFYLCGAFHYDNSAQSRRWWCDGIVELSITELAPIAFLIVVAAYWAPSAHRSSPFYLAPLELELYFHSPGDLDAERTIIRFGYIDRFGDINRVRYDANAIGIVQNRPTSNQDWAFAIELS